MVDTVMIGEPCTPLLPLLGLGDTLTLVEGKGVLTCLQALGVHSRSGGCIGLGSCKGVVSDIKIHLNKKLSSN